ncbi:DUF6479 family protein [Streptomyces sp. NPDC029003]|uniref:DUF6479 family protein n=1 Tax=Streptomyces sp. NPDC029003 TaxID=3155125 RepID=UPI0033D3AEAB
MIATETLAATLAAEGSGALFLIVAGVVVAALLVAAFWFGSRRSARRRAPARPAEQNPAAQRRQGSWQTPEGGEDGPRPPV